MKVLGAAMKASQMPQLRRLGADCNYGGYSNTNLVSLNLTHIVLETASPEKLQTANTDSSLSQVPPQSLKRAYQAFSDSKLGRGGRSG